MYSLASLPHSAATLSSVSIVVSITHVCTIRDSIYMNPFHAVIEGQIIRVTEHLSDHRYSETLTVRVMVVHYDDIGQIEAGDIVSIKVCSLPLRIRFKRTYHLAGSRECGTNELEISESGVIAERGKGGSLEPGPCPAHIRAGNCDA